MQFLILLDSDIYHFNQLTGGNDKNFEIHITIFHFKEKETNPYSFE